MRFVVKKEGMLSAWSWKDGGWKPDELMRYFVAVGRQARLEGYGLENLGIETSVLFVTDDYLEKPCFRTYLR